MGQIKGGIGKVKKVLLLISIFVIATVPLFAEGTSQANWNKDLGKCGNSIRNYVAGHNHDYEQYTPDYGAGIGVDLIVYEGEEGREGLKKAIPDTVTIQQKFDIANENGSTYLVASYNIWDLFKKDKEGE